MKKFLLSLCAIAVAGVCLFMTSCKDDDDPIIYNDIASAIKNVMDPNATYRYWFDGREVIPPTPEQLQKEIQNAGEGEHTITMEMETPDGQKQTATTNITIGSGSGTAVLNVPTTNPNGEPTTEQVEFHYTTSERHNGGAAGTK